MLELVVLHLGGSLAPALQRAGSLWFGAGMGSELISGLDQGGGFWALTPAVVSVKAFRQAD